VGATRAAHAASIAAKYATTKTPGLYRGGIRALYHVLTGRFMSHTEPKCTVLVVEDDRDVRDAIAEVLDDSGYLPVLAANGREALARLRSGEPLPHLILLDLMMPEMDGWEFRSVQGSDPALSGVPVVVLTAHADAQDAADRMHAAGFLRKPVQLTELLAVVARHGGG
jgi:two-component system response regulator MprA